MIHVRIDKHHSTAAVDIYVNISPKLPITSSSSSSSAASPGSSSDEHIYDRLVHTENFLPRQSKIVRNRSSPSIQSMNKKNYTLEQILDNVETIQKQYEQVIHTRTTSTPSCFFSFKQITKILKHLRTVKTKTHEKTIETDYSENKSPFIFGGETLQWIALPQDAATAANDHIYENEILQ